MYRILHEVLYVRVLERFPDSGILGFRGFLGSGVDNSVVTSHKAY